MIYLISPWAATWGADICDLIGLFLLNDLENLSKSKYIGLYHDDELMVTKWSNANKKEQAKI